jgi:hypothetical protein
MIEACIRFVRSADLFDERPSAIQRTFSWFVSALVFQQSSGGTWDPLWGRDLGSVVF